MLLLFIIFATGAAGIHAETVIEQSGAGRGLGITTDPPDAKVYIDGIERGKTPLVLPDIVPGTHTVRLTKDYYEDWERSVSFSSGGRMNINVDLVFAKGQVSLSLIDSVTNRPVETAGEGAGRTIYVDGIPRNDYSEGSSPLILLLPEGRRTISARIFGYNEGKISVFVERSRVTDVQLAMEPAELRLEGLKTNRKSFNPANLGALGTVILYFSVTTAGFGRLTVTDEDGNAVFIKKFGDTGSENQKIPFRSPSQSVSWDGKDTNGTTLGPGIWTLNVELSRTEFPAARDDGNGERDNDPAAGAASVSVTINTDGETYPLSLAGGMAGLVNAAYSRTLPQGSFQAEAALLAGSFGDEAAFPALPFALGFRFAPVATVEIGGAVNATAQFGDTVYFGAALSAKKELLRAKKLMPGIALGISGGWINGKIETEQGLLAGIGLNGAFSWDLPAAFSLIFSPAFIWTGEDGYPAEEAPRTGLGGGVLWRHSFIAAGLSLRSLYAFRGEPAGFSPLKISAELHLYPPPSNFVAGAVTTCVLTDGDPRFSGGLTMGFIF